MNWKELLTSALRGVPEEDRSVFPLCRRYGWELVGPHAPMLAADVKTTRDGHLQAGAGVYRLTDGRYAIFDAFGFAAVIPGQTGSAVSDDEKPSP